MRTYEAGRARERPGSPGAASRARSLAPGVAVVLVLATGASGAGRLVPVVGGAVCGLVLGLVGSVSGWAGGAVAPGARYCARSVLKGSIVLLGAGLSLGQVGDVGTSTLPILVPTVLVGLVGAAVLGPALGVARPVGTLIGVGTSICGATAIAAAAAVTDADESDVAPAVWTIFAGNVVAVLLFPVVGHVLDLSQHAFGVWAGTAVNDTSSVTAVAYAYGDRAGADAVVVKLTRSLAIVPVCLSLAVTGARARRRAGDLSSIPWRRVMPLFLVGFAAAVVLNTVGLVPGSWHGPLAEVARFMITMALVGVGLSLDVPALRRTGWRPLVLGAVLWLVLAVTALGLITLLIDGGTAAS